ncbi:MAG TPA: RHS repeat-associated core domain-containing protein [Thermoanaerobaculia bacterium]|nr:RHS repeat-associated core domain-containing protein [Thermoanaerobaculia bacterium]
MNLGRCLFVTMVLLLAMSSELHATCSASVTANVSGTVLSVSGSGGGTCGGSSISVTLDGHEVASQTCGGGACSVSKQLSTACLLAGTHTVTANVACGRISGSSCDTSDRGTASTTFTIAESKPTVSLSVVPSATGLADFVIHYNFPNTDSPAQRRLILAIPGLGFSTDRTLQPETASGDWTVQWDLACYRSDTQYQFKATALNLCTGESAADTKTISGQKPEVSIAFAPGADGKGTIQINYNFPATGSPNQRTVGWTIPGPGFTSVGSIQAPTQQGTHSIEWSVACYPPGTYTFTATAKKCDELVTSTVTFSVSAKPTVGINVTPHDDGIATVDIAYNFPGTSDASQRTVGRTFPGPGFVSVDAFHPVDAQGVWSFPFDLSCYPADAPYTFTATALSCSGEKATATTPVKGQDPEVAISFAPDANGNGEVSITYDFRGTSSSGQRLLVREFTNADGSINSDSLRPATRNGVWRIPWSVSCFPPGTYPLKARARRCDLPQVTAQTNVPVDRSPQITEFTVQPPLAPIANEQEWVLSYSMPSGSDPRWLRVYLFSYVDDNGEVKPDTLLYEQLATQNSGTIRQTFTPPAGAHNGLLRAVVSNCAGVAAQNAAFTCDSCSAAPSSTHKPVFLSDGNMRLSDVDPLPPLTGLAGLARTYDSSHGLRGLFGRGWGTFFDQRLLVSAIGGTETVHFTTGTNDIAAFAKSGSAYTQTWPLSAQPGALSFDATAGQYAYRPAGGTTVLLFRASDGRIAGVRDLTTGRAVDIFYDPAGLPSTATESWTGLTWRMTVDAPRRLVTSISVDGQPSLVWQYTYDSSDHLHTVSAPGNLSWRTYEYTGGRMTLALDALGNVIESHTYDAAGRATSSHGGTEQIDTIQYGLAGPAANERITRVTLKSGNVTDFVLTPSGGSLRTARVIGTCTTCSGARDSTYVYDSRGRVVREQDATGYVTLTAYDAQSRVSTVQQSMRPAACDPATSPSQCRMDAATLQSAPLITTTASITRTYVYGDARWPDRATAVTMPSLVSGRTRREDMSYTPTSGSVATTSVTGWVGDGRVQRSTRTEFYGDGVRVDPEGDGGEAPGPYTPSFNPGGAFDAAWLSLPQPGLLRRSVGGPRSDVNDVTAFVYYPVDNSVPALWRGQLAAIRNPAGHITRFEDYDPFGAPRRTIDPNAVVTEQVRDNLGRITTTMTKAVPSCDVVRDPLCATDLTMQREYSGAGPIRRETRAGGGVTEYTYDEETRVRSISRGTSPASLQERITYEYDPVTGKKGAERLQGLVNGQWIDKNVTSYTYDALAQLEAVAHADGSSVRYAYDPAGRVASVRDERHTTPNTFYSYDPAGRMATVRQTLSTAPAGSITTSYVYDLHGNLTAVTDPNGNTTSYVYDDFAEMTRQQSPVSGVTTYDYDLSSNLVSMTDANGATTTRRYDALSRVLAATTTRGSESEIVTWTYDTAAFGIGRAATMTDPTGSTNYVYERRGLLASEVKTIGSASYTTRCLYDADGNRSRITYPSGRSVDYTFDYADRPLTASVGTATLVSTAAYLPFGPLASISYGNGTVRTTTYDDRYRPLVNALTLGGEPLASHTYQNDAAGNILAISDDVDTTYSRTFAYDDLNRLITANTSEDLWGSGTYTYDAMGNMKSLRLGRSRNATFAFTGTLPKLASVVENGTTKAVTYDAAGNELTYGAVAYDYSPRNHLRAQNGINYGYDGRGLRTTTLRAARVVSLTVTPSTVTGAAQLQGVVTLSSVTGAGGQVVTLTCSSAAVTVPPSVTVAAGQASATFSVTTSNVAAQTNAKITASFNGSTTFATLTISGSRLDGLRATPATVTGGDDIVGDLALTADAPEEGVAAQLTSSNPAAAAPPREVVIPGGRSSAQFTITTAAVAARTDVVITASVDGEQTSTTVTVLPPALASLTLTPSRLKGGALTGEVMLTGIAGSRDVNVALSTSPRIAAPSSVTIPAGSRSASFSVTVEPVEESSEASVTATYLSGSATAAVTIDPPALVDFAVAPALVVGGEPVTAQAVLDAPAAAEGAAIGLSSSDGSLVAAPSRMTVGGGQTVAAEQIPTTAVAAPTPVVVSATREGVTRSSTVTLTPPPVTIANLTLGNASVVGTNLVVAKLTLTDAAPAAGVEVELSSSDTAVASVPPSITVPPGAREVSFTVETYLVTANSNVTITALHATTEKRATLAVLRPSGNYVSRISATPAFIVGGASASATVTLALPANESGGAEVTLLSDSPAASVPQTVKVHNSSTSASFAITTTTVTTPAAATISAMYGGVVQRTRVIVAPQNAVTLAAFTISPAQVIGGNAATGTLTLSAPAPYGGAVVSLQARRRNMVSVPQTVTIPEGATATTFSIATDVLASKHEKSVEIVATYNGISVSAVLTIAPPATADAAMKPVALCASMTVAPCLTRTALTAAATATTVYETQHTLFTPELTLLAETAATMSGAPPIAYEYVWFAGQPLAQIDNATGAISYYFNDHLGTPILQTSATGRIVWEPQYDPYGTIVSFGRGESKHQPLRFPGQTANDDGDLYQNVFRWYRAGAGRYTQADPLDKGEGGIYVYAAAVPSAVTDPLGLYTVLGSASPGEKARIDEAIRTLLSELANNTTGCSSCQQYFQGLKQFTNLKAWMQPGGPPYIGVITPPSGVSGAAHSQKAAPWWYTWLYRRNFTPGNYLLSPCRLASLILHEVGHLARNDTVDNEPPEFFQKCRFGCINPGEWH